MKRKLLERITRHLAPPARLVALLLAVCAAGSAWAAISLEESGATVPTTATLAFKNVTLSQLTTDTLSGVMGGSWAGEVAGAAMTFNNFDRTNEGTGTITCEAQIQHGENIKGVMLTFTQDGANVNVVKTGAKYVSGTVGASIASGTTGYYDVSKLTLSRSIITPIAVFDGASGGFKKTSINGVTFDKNGNTVADDGSYVKISSTVGALFKLSAGYSYVVGEFTVNSLDESATGDRVLAIWSPNEDGTGSTTLGTLLKSGSVSTCGVWNNAIWEKDNTTLNGTLATGVSTDTSRTFALATEDSKVNGVQNNTGTHFFELTGSTPGTAVYGSDSDMGLRGDQTYRTLVIGGPATGSLSAMTDLVITKVVIYASNARQFTTTATTTIANIDNPAGFYVGNGETINASSVNAGVTSSSTAYVYTEAGSTINLDAEFTAGKCYFAGSITGIPGIADGLTLASANDKVTTSNKTYVPVLKGSGTIVYPDNTIPDASSLYFTSTDWAGTVSLSNISGSSNSDPGWYAPFHNYGSANSTIKVAGFTGFFGAGNYETAATLEIAAGSTFTLNNGNGGNSMTFGKLTGSGDIVICGNNTPAIQYVMRDASEFSGNITVSANGGANFKKSIVLGGGSSYNYNTGNYQKQICVLGDVTIAAGKTWTAEGGIVVNGTVTLADSTSTLSGTISGNGEIDCTALPDSNLSLASDGWTGTVVLPSFEATGQNLNNYGVSGSTVAITGMTGWIDTTGVSIAPNLRLDGTLEFSAMSPKAYSFQKISGTGNISFNKGNNEGATSVSIAEIASGYSGTVMNATDATVTIDKLSLASAPFAGDKILTTSNTASGSIEITAVYVNDVETALDLEYRSDGVYVSELQGVGYMDGTTAVITDTSAAVTVPSGATAVRVYPTSNSTSLIMTYSQASSLLNTIAIYATYTVEGETYQQNIKDAFTSSMASVDSNFNVTLTLSGTDAGDDTSVTVGNEVISVTPALAASEPIAVATAMPSFAVKTIPGLWYSLLACDTASGVFASEATVQATTTTTTLTATTSPTTVRYYKLGVDVAEPQQ